MKQMIIGQLRADLEEGRLDRVARRAGRVPVSQGGDIIKLLKYHYIIVNIIIITIIIIIITIIMISIIRIIVIIPKRRGGQAPQGATKGRGNRGSEKPPCVVEPPVFFAT